MHNENTVIENFYKSLKQKHEIARKALGRPLTLAEKILSSHMKEVADEDGNKLIRKESYALFYPDRVAMQDATAQMALLQFMLAGKDEAAVPTTVHCDHLIAARKGANSDLNEANHENAEVYDFLSTVSQKYNIGFWKPGSGIIHQVVLENYAFPGGMMIGTDSHTPNAGGLGMLAIGVGGADAVDVMVGEPFNLKWPGVIGVKLTGKLNGWTSPKDIILHLMGILTVKGGTGHIVEFFGDGAESISATGKGTICNMGAEHGATTSVFPYDLSMEQYLQSSARPEIARLANEYKSFLCADPEVYANPEQFFDRVVHIDLNTLEPYVVGPHSPDLARPISKLKEAVIEEKYPSKLAAALIGSCTNSSYEDIGRSASIAEAATNAGLRATVPFYVTPGSETVHATIKRDGQMQALEKMGGLVLANACGPCIGQWHRSDIHEGDANTIISSYNRNFPGRNDGNRATLSFLASPEIVTAMSLAGTLSFNPLTDTLESNGKQIKLPEPKGDSLPKQGLAIDRAGFVQAPTNRSSIVVKIAPDSQRLAQLDRFAAWDGNDFVGLPLLLKAKGKCTTDHISAAGKWLAYRGHLDKIANNTYIGAINAFSGQAGAGKHPLDSSIETKSFPAIARDLKAKGISWIVIGDENFGEGSSREHAAMQPRHLGCKAILVKSFARIHESNLKKHGILPMTFANPTDYDLVREGDRIDVVGVNTLAPKSVVNIVLHHADGTTHTVEAKHTMSDEQIRWFKAGSALNYLSNQSSR